MISHLKNTTYYITDGGKSSYGFTHEKNDCTVRAVSIAYQISYEEAHAKLKAFGRKDGHGCHYFAKFMNKNMPTTLAITRGWKEKSLGTINKFCKENPKGRFILRIRGHALAVVDGIVHDSWLPGSCSRILDYWKVD